MPTAFLCLYFTTYVNAIDHQIGWAKVEVLQKNTKEYKSIYQVIYVHTAWTTISLAHTNQGL